MLIRSRIYDNADHHDVQEINGHISKIRNSQMPNGSWEETSVATVHHIDELLDLGVSKNDPAIMLGAEYLLENLDKSNCGLIGPMNKKEVGKLVPGSLHERELEFQAAMRYKKEMDPRKVCFVRLGIMQSALALRPLLQLGYEKDERAGSELERIFRAYQRFDSLCYFDIKRSTEDQC